MKQQAIRTRSDIRTFGTGCVRYAVADPNSEADLLNEVSMANMQK